MCFSTGRLSGVYTVFQSVLSSVYDLVSDLEVDPIPWRRKDGGSVRANVILAPFPFEDHLLALHYVTEK